MGTAGLNSVRDRIAAAAARAGKRADDIELVVVSKMRSDTEILDVYEAGERTFGENRQQGLRDRIEASLPDDIVWHFIGPLQSRKVRYVATHASLLHSLDRISLAHRWVAAGGGPALIQFNVAAEPQKTGFVPDAADQVLDAVLEVGIDVRGVMAIPPIADDPRETAPWFAQLRSIFDSYRDHHRGIDVCSMGMTDDFEVAIAKGATTIRVGRAIFEDTNDHHH